MTTKTAVVPVSATGANDDNVVFGETDVEVERLKLQHEVIRSHMRDLIVAPINLSKSGLRILDQATADGTWLLDVRQSTKAEHEYVGTDIADSYFPKHPPSNVSFHHQSMTEPWPVDWNGTFDLVHSRFALAGAGMKPLDGVVKGLVGLLKPGGYIQLVEVDPEDPEGNGPAMQRFGIAFRDMLKVVSGGKGMNLKAECPFLLQQAGCLDVKQRLLALSMGAQAEKDVIKNLSVKSMQITAQGLADFFEQVLPISLTKEQLRALPGDLANELPVHGGVFRISVVYGRRP